MKVLIQNPENSLYYAGFDRWLPEVAEAFDFGNSDNAIKFSSEKGVSPVHVVLHWSGIGHSIVIPIGAGHQQTESDKGRERTRV